MEQLGVYEIKDRKRSADVIGEPENCYLGLTYPDRRKTLAFFTVQRLAALLHGPCLTIADRDAVLLVTVGAAGEFHHLCLRPDGSQILILWDKRESPQLEVHLGRGGSAYTE